MEMTEKRCELEGRIGYNRAFVYPRKEKEEMKRINRGRERARERGGGRGAIRRWKKKRKNISNPGSRRLIGTKAPSRYCRMSVLKLVEETLEGARRCLSSCYEWKMTLGVKTMMTIQWQGQWSHPSQIDGAWHKYCVQGRERGREREKSSTPLTLGLARVILTIARVSKKIVDSLG